MINDDDPLMVVPYGQPKTGGSPMSQAGSRPRDAWLAPSCRQYTFSSRHAQVPERYRADSQERFGRLLEVDIELDRFGKGRGSEMNSNRKPVAVVVGATSKWQSDGRNTQLAHGRVLDDSDLPVGVRWGVGGAIAQKFAMEDFFVVLTTRSTPNATPLQAAIQEQGGESMIVELDLVSSDSISEAFAQVREEAGDPNVLVYNAGYLEGRDLPPEMELLEHIPVDMFDTAQHISSRGPFLVAKEVLPAMRERGEGSFLISNNSSSLRGKKRYTGQSLYYPRVMMRTLAQVLTEEYSEFGVHVAKRRD